MINFQRMTVIKYHFRDSFLVIISRRFISLSLDLMNIAYPVLIYWFTIEYL